MEKLVRIRVYLPESQTGTFTERVIYLNPRQIVIVDNSPINVQTYSVLTGKVEVKCIECPPDHVTLHTSSPSMPVIFARQVDVEDIVILP